VRKRVDELAPGDRFSRDQYPAERLMVTHPIKSIHIVATKPHTHPHVGVYAVPVEGRNSPLNLPGDQIVTVHNRAG